MKSTGQATRNPLLLEGLRILAVDDEEDALLLLTVILESQGAIVTPARSVQVALEALSCCPADLIISDVAMPDEDGLALIQKIRSLEKAQGGAVPAIAYSALDPELCASECLKVGFQSYVAKPVDPEILTAVILDTVSLQSKQRQKQLFKLTVNRQSRLA
jgi:CheY-like chemotaxis protein